MSAHTMPVRYRMPFNYAQVLIAAFSATALCTFLFFASEAAGASMRDSGLLFRQLQFIDILRVVALPMLLLGMLTFVIGRLAPRFCRFAQVVGVLVVLASLVLTVPFAADLLSAIALAIMHLVVATFWYIAVNYSNLKYNEREAAKEVALR